MQTWLNAPRKHWPVHQYAHDVPGIILGVCLIYPHSLTIPEPSYKNIL